MGTLNATTIPPSSLSQANQQPSVDWDENGIGEADEIVAGENGGQEVSQEEAVGIVSSSSSASEWNLDDDWGTNLPVSPPTIAVPEETFEADPSLVDDADPEAVVEVDTDDALIDAIVGTETEIAASEEVSTEAQPSAGEPTEVTSDDILAEIADAERECERAAAVVEGLKSRLKEAKTELDAAVGKLRRLAREIAEDADRPMLTRPAAVASATPTNAVSSPTIESVEDSIDEESATEVEEAEVNRGKPTRIRITAFDPDWPQIPIGAEHDVHAIEEDGTIVIQDPAKVDGEILLSPASGECEVIAWEELPVEVVAISTGPNSAAASQAKANEKNSRPEDDSWRKASLLDDVGLPPNLAALLEANPEKTLKTMGDVHDWTEKGKFLSDIPKIGPAKVTQLEDAFEKFWAKWNAKK